MADILCLNNQLFCQLKKVYLSMRLVDHWRYAISESLVKSSRLKYGNQSFRIGTRH